MTKRSKQGKSLKKRTKQGANRKTPHLFDLMAKFILQEASPRAVVHLINGLFGTAFSPDTAITFKGTESVRIQAVALEGLRADFIIEAGGREFLIEFQITHDQNMALRMLDYGYAQARRKRRLSGDGRFLVMRLPDPAVVYLEPDAGNKPACIGSVLENVQGERLHYRAGTYEVAPRNFAEVERLHLHLLLPFYLLIYRQEVKKSGAAERRGFAWKAEALMNEVETMLQRGNRQGVLTAEDAVMLMERMDQMYQELYGMYPEFQEEHMNVQKRFKLKWREYLQDDLNAERQEGRQEGQREERAKILGLFKQGYTVEQVETALARESGQQSLKP